MSAPLLECAGLDVGIAGLALASALDLTLSGGEMVCVIGCNGAGKTTLLHTLAGLREQRAAIRLGGRALAGLSRRDIARGLALLLQQHDDAFPMTVHEAVSAARHPHRPLLYGETSGDAELVTRSLQRLGLGSFAGRDVATLSGGERQRVAIAAALAQQPDVYLLDEPLNNLDPRHQLEVMRNLRAERARGAAILAVLHDVNLVERYADRVLLLYGPAHGGRWLSGPTAQVLSADNLSRLYGIPLRCATLGERRYFYAE